MDDVGGIGQQVRDYATQVADINTKISALPRGDGGLLPDDKETYGRLKAQRDALADKASALTAKAKSAGAEAPDFSAEVKRLAKEGAAKKPQDDVGADQKLAAAAADPTKKLDAVTETPAAESAAPPAEASQPVEAESADGVIHEFPPGTKPEVIDRVMKQYAQEQKTPLAPQAPGERRPEDNVRPEPTEKDLPPEAAATRTGTTSLVSGGAPRVNAEDAFKEREAYEKSLRAKGVDPKTDPKYREMLKRQAQGQAQDVEETAGYAGLGGAKGAAGLVGKGALKAGEMLKGVGSDVLGTGARAAVKDLKGDIAGRAGAAASAEDATGAAAAQRAEELKAAELKAGQPDRVRKQIAPLEKQYAEAGATKDEATKLAETHQARIEDAEKAVDDLDKELLAKPGTTADELGGKLRAVTEQLHEKYSTQRAQLSGYGKALDTAGDELRVNTQGARGLIDANLKDVRNPSLQRVLNGVKDLMTTETGDVAHEGLSLRSAESLRKYLDSVIQSKMFGDQAVDRETIYVLRQVKDSLVQTMKEYEPYAAASRKWAELSRPLDIVERKGALKKVLDTDPLSTDYALTDAQVVGQAITKAKAGSPTLARLAEENPSIKIPARLYFTQSLFGEEAVPTVARLRTWLKQNEQPLRQLGLYDEFRDIRVAKETAQKAVETAKGAAKETMAQAKVAEREEQQAAKRLREGQAFRDKNQKGLVKRLSDKRGEATKTQEKSAGAADNYRRLETELKTAVDKAVPTKAREFLSKMVRDGKLDQKTYGELLEKVNAVEQAKLSSREMRKRVAAIAVVAAASSGVPWAYRKLGDLIR